MDKMICVFGGTFNPIHSGHVEIAKSVLKLPNVEKLIIMPTYQPPHKEAADLASGVDRLNMCRIALAGEDNIEFSDLELSRGGASYTYDTVVALNKIYKKRIAIVCGGDMITTFSSWYRYRDILALADLIAYHRAGIADGEFADAVNALKAEGGNITVIDADITDISSSQIRNGNLNLLPKGVLEYIKANNLYGVRNGN